MFSFHKPKIYRSIKGCCICRAKSSSSRFTDSKRYEHDFDRCFKIKEHRAGEICNACVLLVKRWKKLPSGSTRNWHHVVDARAGPGTKSMNKIKNKAKEEKERKKLAKHKHKHKKRVMKAPGGSVSAPNSAPQSPGAYSDDVVVGDDCLSDGASDYLSNSDSEDDVVPEPPKQRNRRKLSTPVQFSSFLDLTYWKKTEVCCGIIFKGINGEVLLDTSLWRPCRSCKPSSLTRQNSQSMASDESDDNSIMTAPQSPAVPVSASMPSSPQCRPLSPAMPTSLSMPSSPQSCPRSPPMLESVLYTDMEDSQDAQQSSVSSSQSTATDPQFTDSAQAQLDCLTAAARAAESASAILDLSIPKPPLLSRAEPCRPIVQMEV